HRESDAPDPAAEQVHAQQARNEKIDVARAWRRCPNIARDEAVRATLGPLQHVVDFEPGPSALRPRRVVPVDERVAMGARYHEQRDASRAQPRERRRGIEHARGEPRGRVEDRGNDAVALARLHADLELAGPGIPKREAERKREHDGKPEDPEYCLGLTIELAHARERELEHRMLTYHAAAVP